MDVWTNFDLASLYRYRKANNLPTSPDEFKTPVIVFIDHPIDSRDWIDIKEIEIKSADIHSIISPSPEELVMWYEIAKVHYDKRYKEHIEYMRKEFPDLATDEEAAAASPYIRTNLVGSDASFETADRLIGAMVRNFLVETVRSHQLSETS